MTSKLDTADLLEEASSIADEDARQEYLTLRLEGHVPEVALQKCARASQRSLRARSAPGESVPSEFRSEDWTREQAATSITMDSRTDAERAEGWARQDFVRDFLCGLDPRTRLILSLRFGLGGEPMTPEAVAAEVGVSISTVDRTIQRARKVAQ